MNIFCGDVLVRAQYAFDKNGIGVYIFTEDRKEAAEIVMRPVKEDGLIGAAAWIGKNSAQRLMDDLWDAGLRPSEGSGSAGQLAAVQSHLEDMRGIAFHSLRIKGQK